MLHSKPSISAQYYLYVCYPAAHLYSENIYLAENSNTEKTASVIFHFCATSVLSEDRTAG